MICPQCKSNNVSELSIHGDVTCLDCGYIFDQDEGEVYDTLIMELRAKLQKIQGLVEHTCNDHREELLSRLHSATALARQAEELLDNVETGIGDIITDLQTL